MNSIQKHKRQKRARIAASKNGGPGLSYTKGANIPLDENGDYPREDLLKCSKKQIVMLGGYPNIKALCKDNPDMKPKGQNINKHNSRATIGYKAYSKKALIAAIV